MKILMTGGTGLIGSHFIKHYPQYHYTLLTRSPTKQEPNKNISLVTTLNELENLDDFDAVINLSGEPIMDKKWSVKQKKIIQDSRWDITTQIVNLFEKSNQPPSVFLSGSAIGVYGDMNSTVIDENYKCRNDDFASNLCTQWESTANKASEKTRLLNLRTGIVLSKKGGALSKMLPAFRFHLGGKISHGNQYMSWIHINDMVRAIHFLMIEESCNGAYNLTAPTPVTNQEFSQALAATLRKKMLLPMPEYLLKLALGESACLLLDSQRVIPKKLLNQKFSFSYTKIDDALQELLI